MEELKAAAAVHTRIAACKKRGNELFTQKAYTRAFEAYSDGIKEVSMNRVGGSNEIMGLLVTMRANRAACSTALVNEAAAAKGAVDLKLTEQGWDDCTAVLDLPQHTQIGLLLKVHMRRAELLLAGIRSDAKFATATGAAAASDGLRTVLESPASTEDQRARGQQLQAELHMLVPTLSEGTALAPASISEVFLNLKHLKRVPELRVGAADEPKISVARRYMDKAAPCNMKDGTPKEYPSELLLAPDAAADKTAVFMQQMLGP
eukprot:5301033-Prymnesium_polylepis.1